MWVCVISAASFLSNKLTSGDGVKTIKDGACHSLIIDCCSKDDSAVYRFEAEGRKSEATLDIKGQKKIQKCFKLTEGLSIIIFLFKTTTTCFFFL